jgi:hypothetical protein
MVFDAFSQQCEVVEANLRRSVDRLDVVMVPWGFTFKYETTGGSHGGPFASGHYVRGATQIGLSCRATLDNLYYNHSFVKQHLWSRETETFTIGHDLLMKALGRESDCQVLVTHNPPTNIVSRTDGDVVQSLLHDWSSIAADVLREPCEEFFGIMRRGFRSYVMEPISRTNLAI